MTESRFKRLRQIDTSVEREIITGLIVSDSFCTQVLPISKYEFFKLDYARPVVRWINEYYERYNCAPKKDLQKIYDDKSQRIDKSLAENIEFLLEKASSNHEVKNFDSLYQVDQAKKYFKERALRIKCENIQKLLDAGKIEEATRYEDVDVVYEASLSDFFNPFDDSEMKSFFADEENKIILNFKGALGKLVGGFQRNNLVVITGVEKRGKSWWLMELAFEALCAGLKVVFFSFEMNKHQIKERAYAMTTGLYPEKAEESFLPVFDCRYNQSGSCQDKRRKNKINHVLSTVEPDQNPDYESFPDYVPCTICRGEKHFKLAVWAHKIYNEKTITYEELKKHKMYIKGKKNLKMINYPSFSAGSIEMRNDLKNLAINGFKPDVVITDYLDIQKREGNGDERTAINKIWQNGKRIASELNCVHITADQADAAARNQKELKQKNFSESKQKDGVLDIRIGLSQEDEEKEIGIMRVNVLYKRMGRFIPSKHVMVTQSLSQGQCCIDSEFV